MSRQEMTHGNWLQLKGQIRHRWGKLTDDEITAQAGNKEEVIGKLISDYARAIDRARSHAHQITNH